jgi:putative PIN family toxin of toxin-antitoxin system
LFKKNLINTSNQFKKIVLKLEKMIFNTQFKMINSISKKEYLYHTRDKKDDRILDAAICGNLDAILTGDKDLIQCRCSKIRVLDIH